MKVKLISDLHLEFSQFSITYDNEDILIIAGDISPYINMSLNFVKNYLNKYPNTIVLYILGNHDYYGRSIQETNTFWESIVLDNFYYIQNQSIVIDGIRFFGSTLWTDMDNFNSNTVNIAKKIINDYHLIKGPTIKSNFLPLHSYKIHNESKMELIKCLDESKEPVVVITHHLPSYKSIADKYKHLPANGSFASNLDDLVERAYMFFHGHTHTSFDYHIGNTRVICNPRGYCDRSPENKNFDPHLIIEITP